MHWKEKGDNLKKTLIMLTLKNMNKKLYFILIGLLWIMLLGGFIVIKEFTLQTGDEILLKTEPVDPRDLFRGDYVVLRYDISQIDLDKFNLVNKYPKTGKKIYVTLNIGEDKVATIDDISLTRPTKGKFIAGTISNVYGNRANVTYGIESYFVPESKGREIEKNLRDIYVKVAIDDFGLAAIKALILDGKEITFN